MKNYLKVLVLTFFVSGGFLGIGVFNTVQAACNFSSGLQFSSDKYTVDYSGTINLKANVVGSGDNCGSYVKFYLTLNTKTVPMGDNIGNQQVSVQNNSASATFTIRPANFVLNSLPTPNSMEFKVSVDNENGVSVAKSSVLKISVNNLPGTIYACVASDGKYACSPGNKKDLSDVPNNACTGKTSAQISAEKCGQSSTLATTPGATTSTTAGGMQGQQSSTLYNPIKGASNLTELLLKIMRGFIMITGIWAAAFIVIGGFKMVISQGNEEAVTAAKKSITWSVIGLIVVLLAFSIMAIIQNLIDIDVKEVKTSQTNSIQKI